MALPTGGVRDAGISGDGISRREIFGSPRQQLGSSASGSISHGQMQASMSHAVNVSSVSSGTDAGRNDIFGSAKQLRSASHGDRTRNSECPRTAMDSFGDISIFAAETPRRLRTAASVPAAIDEGIFVGAKTCARAPNFEGLCQSEIFGSHRRQLHVGAFDGNIPHDSSLHEDNRKSTRNVPHLFYQPPRRRNASAEPLSYIHGALSAVRRHLEGSDLAKHGQQDIFGTGERVRAVSAHSKLKSESADFPLLGSPSASRQQEAISVLLSHPNADVRNATESALQHEPVSGVPFRSQSLGVVPESMSVAADCSETIRRRQIFGSPRRGLRAAEKDAPEGVLLRAYKLSGPCDVPIVHASLPTTADTSPAGACASGVSSCGSDDIIGGHADLFGRSKSSPCSDSTPAGVRVLDDERSPQREAAARPTRLLAHDVAGHSGSAPSLVGVGSGRRSPGGGGGIVGSGGAGVFGPPPPLRRKPRASSRSRKTESRPKLDAFASTDAACFNSGTESRGRPVRQSAARNGQTPLMSVAEVKQASQSSSKAWSGGLRNTRKTIPEGARSDWPDLLARLYSNKLSAEAIAFLETFELDAKAEEEAAL